MQTNESINPYRPTVRAAWYRLPEDVLALINQAVAMARLRGDRVTKEAAVIAAIRGFYGDAKKRS